MIKKNENQKKTEKSNPGFGWFPPWVFRWVCFWVLFGEILKIQKTSKKKAKNNQKNQKIFKSAGTSPKPRIWLFFNYFLIFSIFFWIFFCFFSRFVAFFGFWGSPQTRPRNRPSGTPRGESAKPRIWFFLIFSIFQYFLIFFEFSIWFFFFWFFCVFLIFYFSSNIRSYGIVTVHKTRRAWSKRGHDFKKTCSRLEKIVQRAPLRSF